MVDLYSLLRTRPVYLALRRSKFWNRVEVLGLDDCWLFTGSKDKDGYGTFRLGNEHVRAPRFALFCATLIDPRPMTLHTCDNPPCCNPVHLYSGGNKENAQDRERRGRGWSHAGVNCPHSRFTAQDIKFIRESPSDGVTLAHRFNVTPQAINKIRQYLSYPI